MVIFVVCLSLPFLFLSLPFFYSSSFFSSFLPLFFFFVHSCHCKASGQRGPSARGTRGSRGRFQRRAGELSKRFRVRILSLSSSVDSLSYRRVWILSLSFALGFLYSPVFFSLSFFFVFIYISDDYFFLFFRNGRGKKWNRREKWIRGNKRLKRKRRDDEKGERETDREKNLTTTSKPKCIPDCKNTASNTDKQTNQPRTHVT